jgi:threonine synthase
VAPPAVGLPVGMSPLLPADRLADELGLDCRLFVKTETSNPTHSFKDRVVAIAAAKACELGFEALACASTGNLAGATAAAGAALGLPTYIFVPADLEREKIVSAAAYGATVVAVEGSYDDVNRLCSELAYERPWAFVNVNMRAYYAEGSKTIALETAEQLGWRAPDRVVAPIASGSLYTKILAGFEQGRRAGLIDAGAAPVMHGAQATGCAPVATAFAAGIDQVFPVRPAGIAKSLAIGNPADGVFALDVARRTGGSIEAVDDDEIVEGIRLLASTTGVFTETAGGVTVAVLRRLAERGAIPAGEMVVAYITGDGLKTIDAVASELTTVAVPADVDAVDAALAGTPA